MLATLQPLLEIIDEGLRLYRRYFLTFLAISAVWFVPIAISIGLSFAFWDYIDEWLAVIVIGAWIVLAGPLAIYLVSGISRATQAAAEGRTVSLHNALVVRPLRLFAMCLFALGFYVIANMVSSVITMCVICPLYSVGIGMVGGIGSIAGDGISSALQAVIGVIVIILSVLLYGFALVLSGATYASVVYGLQSFAQEELPLGVCLQRSIDSLSYRLGRNLLGFMLTSMIWGAVTVAITIAVGTLLPLPLLWVLGSESATAQSISAVAWLLGLVVVLPLLPIWMALLYRRNIAQREGYDLAERINALSVQTSPVALP